MSIRERLLNSTTFIKSMQQKRRPPPVSIRDYTFVGYEDFGRKAIYKGNKNGQCISLDLVSLATHEPGQYELEVPTT